MVRPWVGEEGVCGSSLPPFALHLLGAKFPSVTRLLQPPPIPEFSTQRKGKKGNREHRVCKFPKEARQQTHSLLAPRALFGRVLRSDPHTCFISSDESRGRSSHRSMVLVERLFRALAGRRASRAR